MSGRWLDFRVYFRIYNLQASTVLIAMLLILSAAFGSTQVLSLGPIQFQFVAHLSLLLPLLGGFAIAHATALDSNFLLPNLWKFRALRAIAFTGMSLLVTLSTISYLALGREGDEVMAIRNALFYIASFTILQRLVKDLYWIYAASFVLMCMLLGHGADGAFWWALPIQDSDSTPHFIVAVLLWLVALAWTSHTQTRA